MEAENPQKDPPVEVIGAKIATVQPREPQPIAMRALHEVAPAHRVG